MTSPRKWRYTWETLAHIPTLRLYLFTPKIKPLIQCKNLKISLQFAKSQLLLSWNEKQIDDFTEFSLRVPVPKVLIDVSSPVEFKAMEDHIEVKLVLLLPVDDPLFRNFSSGLNISSEERNLSESLSVHSDLKYLSSQSEVHFYCSKCSAKLTKNPLRSFIEMPSADWREVADNWFGSCCCSFGGISEKLVKHYANSYLFSKSTCLLDASSVVVSNRDLAEHVAPDIFNHIKESDVACDPVGKNIPLASVIASDCNGRQTLFSENQSVSANDKSVNVSQIFESTTATVENLSCLSLQKEQLSACQEKERGNTVDIPLIISPTPSDLSGSMPNEDDISSNGNHCCADKSNIISNHDIVGCSHDSSGAKDQEVTKSVEPLRNQNALLNISLGNGFMVRNPNLTKDVDWVELRCPLCSSTLGAYPSNRDVHAPADAGIRLFKCYTSTGLPVDGSDDIFRNYTLHRLFINHLMEIAHDELSFRTVVRDITTRSPMLQIVLLNSDAWRCTGYCLETENIVTNLEKVDMQPIVKMLFSDCSNATEAESRVIEEWATKNEADEIFMLRDQVMILIESLKSEMKSLPPSCSTMQGLSLSSIGR
ncbi:hypothetical protein ACHQM5_030781 [Ranunculus cassubicifolius]